MFPMYIAKASKKYYSYSIVSQPSKQIAYVLTCLAKAAKLQTCPTEKLLTQQAIQAANNIGVAMDISKTNNNGLGIDANEYDLQAKRRENTDMAAASEAEVEQRAKSFDIVDISKEGREAAELMKQTANQEENNLKALSPLGQEASTANSADSAKDDSQQNPQVQGSESSEQGSGVDSAQFQESLKRQLEELQRKAEKLNEEIEALKNEDRENNAELIKQKEAEKAMIASQIAALLQQLQNLQFGSGINTAEAPGQPSEAATL